MVAGARKCDLLAFGKRFFQFIEAGEAAGHGKNRFRLHAAMPLTFCLNLEKLQPCLMHSRSASKRFTT